MLPRSCQRKGAIPTHATGRALRVGAALFLLALAGCAKPPPRPGVTGNVTVITRGNGGRVVPQEPVTRFESAVVNTTQEISHGDQTLSLLVRKTEYGKGTFEITFPDKTTQRVRVNAGETRDVLPEGQAVGLRIELQEAR
jgi:hypothetical protein